MSSDDFSEWTQGEIDPNISEKFLSESELDAPEETEESADAARCWYAACNRGETGVKHTTRAAARKDAVNHQRATGHGSGVMGPVNC